MFDKLRSFIDSKYNRNVGYYSICIIYTVSMIMCMFVLSFLFDNYSMAIIGTIIINGIRKYSGGFHCHKLENCILLTNVMFLLFGILSKYTIDYIGIIFIVCLFCSKNIYINSPIMETDYTDKSKSWHKNNIIVRIFIMLFISLYFIYGGYYILANNILLSIIMVDLLLFENVDDNERKGEFDM